MALCVYLNGSQQWNFAEKNNIDMFKVISWHKISVQKIKSNSKKVNIIRLTIYVCLTA